jgi:hypothetical protein
MSLLQCLLVISNANLMMLISVVIALFCLIMFNIYSSTHSFYEPPHHCLFKGVCTWLCPVHLGNVIYHYMLLNVKKRYRFRKATLYEREVIKKAKIFYSPAEASILIQHVIRQS